MLKMGIGRRRGGSILLLLLVGFVIIMVLYSMQFSAIFDVDDRLPATDEERPWLEDDRIVGPEIIIDLPESPKPSLDKGLEMAGSVWRDGDQRGEITIKLETDGVVGGRWDCVYELDGNQYSYEGEFDGNIDTTKTYVDDDGGKDESLLFMIARGRYAHKRYNSKSGELFTDKGTVYMTGWLGRNYIAEGHLTITTDRTWSAVYEFECQ